MQLNGFLCDFGQQNFDRIIKFFYWYFQTSNSLPWSQSGELRENFPEEPLTPPTKRSRNNEHRFSPSPASSATNNNNNNGDQLMRDTLLGQALEGGPTIYTGSTSHQVRKIAFLGMFTKLQKVTISIIVSICPHRITWIPLDRFSWNLIFEYVSKVCGENSNFLTIWQE